MHALIQLISNLIDSLIQDPLQAADIEYTFAERRADYIARRITDMEGILRNLRDKQALCDRAADLAYEELEREEMNALLREHREFLDREAVVAEELNHLRDEIEEIEAELVRRGAL